MQQTLAYLPSECAQSVHMSCEIAFRWIMQWHKIPAGARGGNVLAEPTADKSVGMCYRKWFRDLLTLRTALCLRVYLIMNSNICQFGELKFYWRFLSDARQLILQRRAFSTVPADQSLSNELSSEYSFKLISPELSLCEVMPFKA